MTREHKDTSEVISDGLREIRARYWQDVRDFAAEIVADNPEDENAQSDAAHEYADGSQWVIYTRMAYLVALVSDNADAHEDAVSITEGGRVGETPTLDSMVTLAAYFAMRADIEAQIQALRA